MGSLEYAQARLQSRHGQRPVEAAWHRLEVCRTFDAALDAARTTALQRWLGGITRHDGAHTIEAALRQHWQGTVCELAGWMPARWRPPLAWCAWLPDLPVLQHLLRGGPPAAWMRDMPAWRALNDAPAAERAAVLADGPLAALADAAQRGLPLLPAWHAEWTARLPCPLGGEGDPLQQLVRTLQDHGALFAAAPPGPGGLLRRTLQDRLSLLLRRATLSPAAAFIHLALCALDLERLRGELLSRLLFPRQPTLSRVS